MESIIKEGRTRREFLMGAGAVVAGGVVVGVVGSQLSCEEIPGVGAAEWWTAGSDPMVLAPPSQGYLVHDEIKCVNCKSCMSACSLVNEGRGSYSLARRQVIHSSFVVGPHDVQHADCRQCVYPACIEACPTGALHADPDNGFVRTVDRSLCEGTGDCMDACPYTPFRIAWIPYEENAAGELGVAATCDLCKSAPYWSGGGFDGTQACVSVCPMQAIALVTAVPDQRDALGYDVNLRTENWTDTMDRPNTYGELARNLTSPVRDERGVLRPGGGSTYDPDPLPPPYEGAVWPYPHPNGDPV